MALVRGDVKASVADAEAETPLNEEPTNTSADATGDASEEVRQSDVVETQHAETTQSAEDAPEAEAEAEQPAGSQAEAEASEDVLPFEADEEQLAADQAEQAKAEAAAKAALEGAASTGTAMATSQASQLSKTQGTTPQVIQDLAADGFDGLTLEGFGAFPIIKLENEGHFADTDEHIFGRWFTGVVQNTRAKFVYKNEGCAKKDELAIYSYDMELDSNTGEPLQDTFDEWKKRGWTVEKKQYLELTLILHSSEKEGDERHGAFMLVSIPPTSRNRISGFFSQIAFTKGGLRPNKYVTKFVVGDKVTKADNPFYPWHFEFVEKLEDTAA